MATAGSYNDHVFRRASRRARVVAYLIPIGVIGVCAEVLFAIPAITAGAAAPVLLLAVLLIARELGTGPALVGSHCCSASHSRSTSSLRSASFIEDLNDWVAFGVFTITAVVVGELAARAERRQLRSRSRDAARSSSSTQQLGAAFERASEAEAARRNEQLKAALLDALTHNLRTPLTAIKASVTALLGSDDDRRVRRCRARAAATC